MCKIDGLMDQHLYTEILKEHLLQTLVEYGNPPASVIVMQDNDLKHTSKKARQFLGNHSPAVLPWPANTPAFNPIEHQGNDIKKRLKDFLQLPNEILELWDRIQDEWAKIPADECQNLIESLSTRIYAVIRAKGGHVEYKIASSGFPPPCKTVRMTNALSLGTTPPNFRFTSSNVHQKKPQNLTF
ncbi:hypothetical protein K3495_g3559 [Podosphaera aphanis]|nr:hypothetical protein K3495_g3559 [Podosphaera aphanis]